MNVKQNLKNYGMYIFSMIFSIVVFYNFLTVCFSDQFETVSNVSMVQTIAFMCIYVLTLFFIFFISYSSKFFVEQRKKEFGIYTFMGVENKKIAFLFAFEGLLVGLIALLSGLAGGILVNKLFLMALVKLSNVETVMKFEINTPSILITAVVFGVILLLTSVKEYINLVRTDITKLINASKSYQVENTKNKTIAGIFGLLVIMFSYFLILYYKEYKINFMLAIFSTITLIIFGTSLLFKGFFSFYLSKKIKNKTFLYKNTNIVTYNNIVFRIRDNNKSLSAVAILITCCLTSMMVSSSLLTVFTNAYSNEVPYSVSYISRDSKDDQVVTKAISESKEKIKYEIEANFLMFKSSLHTYVDEVAIVTFSEIEAIINKKSFDVDNRIRNNKPTVGDAFVIIPGNMIGGFSIKDHVQIGEKEIKIIDELSAPLFGSFFQEALLVVNDQDFHSIQETLKNGKKIQYKAIELEKFGNTEKVTKYIKKHSNLDFYSADMFDQHQYDFINTIYFLGLFVALVFLLSVGSIMYFKCIADAMKDKEKFDVLRKIGTDEEYIKKTVYKQVGIFFVLPIIVGIMHSIVAGYAINELLRLESSVSSVVVVCSFTALYIGYYLLTVKKYLSVTK